MVDDSPYDAIVADPQRLRIDAGSPSYATIALSVSRIREERGVPAAEARPGRTTVYDAFRTGRRRIDEDLLLDIVRALGADEAEVARWTEACRAARRGAAAPAEPEPAAVPRVLTARLVTLLLLGCLALNLANRFLVDHLHLPLYLDMVGTAIAAVVVGPWWGALVGLVTNVGGVAISGPVSAPFALVNVVGALIWGYGVRRYGMARSVPRYFVLNVVVAVACSVVATPILMLRGGMSHHDADNITAMLLATGHSMFVAVFSSNILTSVADKLICGFAALAAAEALGVDLGQQAPPDKRGRRHALGVRRWTDLPGPTLAEER